MTEVRPLRAYAEVVLGRQRSPAHDSGPFMVPYLRAANVKDGELDLSDVKEMNFSPSEQAIFSLKDGDVLVTEGSGSLGAVGASAVWSDDLPGTHCFQNTLLRLRPRAGTDPRFLAWWARYAFADGLFASVATGANIFHVSAERVRSLPMTYLPLPEQRAIADYLDRETIRIGALTAAKHRVVRRLAHREPAYIEESVRRGRWPMVALRRVIVRIEQGWSPQCDARLPEGQEWGVLKVGCVNGGWFKPDEIKALPDDLEPRTEYTVRDGDLLMSRANTRDLVGSVALASSVRPRTLLSDKLYRIKLDEKRADPRFVCLWLQTRAVRSTFELEATGASDSMQNIGQDTVRRVVVPLPPKSDQAQIVADCEWQHHWARSLSLRIRQQIGLLNERRQALISAAVTGQIKVPVAV